MQFKLAARSSKSSAVEFIGRQTWFYWEQWKITLFYGPHKSVNVLAFLAIPSYIFVHLIYGYGFIFLLLFSVHLIVNIFKRCVWGCKRWMNTKSKTFKRRTHFVAKLDVVFKTDELFQLIGYRLSVITTCVFCLQPLVCRGETDKGILKSTKKRSFLLICSSLNCISQLFEAVKPTPSWSFDSSLWCITTWRRHTSQIM